MILVLQIMAVLFMACIMFVAIWGFITLNQMYGQMKYKNYLLEKLTQNVYMLASKNSQSLNFSESCSCSETASDIIKEK